MLALIDGDELCYKLGFGSQHTYYDLYVDVEYQDQWQDYEKVGRFNSASEYKEWIKEEGDPEKYYGVIPYVATLPIKVALRDVKATINTLVGTANANDYLICFSSETNFRNEIAYLYEYKGNRTESEKPVHFKAIKDFIWRNFPCAKHDEYEADDLLAIYYNDDSIIITQDKDLLQVPARFLSLGTKKHLEYAEYGKEFYISPQEGLYNFYSQLLTGDSTDNIPGLYKITGEKCKKEYLGGLLEYTEENDLYNYVHSVYCRNLGCLDGDDLHDILFEIGNLLYIMRSFEDTGWRIPK